jgi:uncharacterized integral membrane protein (TIGR00697 family)
MATMSDGGQCTGGNERFGRQRITAFYAAMLAIANVAAVKVVSVGIWEFTAGLLPIAICYLLSDIAVERYGREFGHSLVWSGVGALLLTIAVSQTVVVLPGSGPVDTVLAGSLPILTASIIAILVSQHLDVLLFAGIKDRLPYRATRNLGSTGISQLLDTALFTILAFAVLPLVFGGQQLPPATIISIIITEWVVKAALAVADTPIFLATTQEVNPDVS